jgi:hypothetical protein
LKLNIVSLMALASIACALPAARADVTDVAKLFPAETLAYAEVVRPGDFTSALAALFQGTPLADPVRFTQDRVEKAQTPLAALAARQSGWLTLFNTPEFAAEAKRLHGVAVGLVGFTESHEPRYAAAVVLGDSHAAGLAVRTFLAVGSDVRRVGVIDGVPVFRHRTFVGRPLDEDGKPIPEQKPANTVEPVGGPPESTYAYVPGLFVVGSDLEAVGDMLRRFAGKGEDKSLATTNSFRRCQTVRDRPGLFFYTTPAALVAKLDAARKVGRNMIDPDQYALLKFAMNARAVKLIHGTVSVGANSIALTAEADLEDATVPLADLLTGPAVPRNIFAHTVGQPGWAMSVSLPDRGRRAQVVLELLDAVARANGTIGRLPSQAVADADREPGPKIIADLLPAVKTVIAFAPTKLELPAGCRPLPMFVFHLESDVGADGWERSAKKLIALAFGTADQPGLAVEVINGVRVTSLAGKDLPGGVPVHFARSGAVVVFGQDRKLVAEAVSGRGVAPAWPVGFGSGSPAGLAVVLPGKLVAHLIPPTKPVKTGEARAELPALLPWLTPAVPWRSDATLSREPLTVGLARAIEPLPPVFAAVNRKQASLQVEMRMPDPAKPMAVAAERFLDWLEKRTADNGDPRMYHPFPGRW